jgi:hypothetical protein
VVDPAKDLGLILRDLGADALEAACRAAVPALEGDDGATDRAALYARCLALEDLAYGLEAGEAVYAEAAHGALERLFGDA